MSLPTLYSTDSKGKVRQWRVWTEGAEVVVEHGLVGGKLQEKRTTSKAKNTGRANATTPEEQAALDAKSKWTAQIKLDDYAENPADANKQLRPMLAHDYHKVSHRVDWKRVLAQPKLDGLRLTYGHRWAEKTDNPELLTRKGETYKLPHLEEHADRLLRAINEALDEVFPGQNMTCQALDGEVYYHGMPLPKIVSRARKYQKGVTEELEYWLFDLVIPGLGFGDRYTILKEALEMMPHPAFRLVDVHQLTEQTLHQQHGVYVEAGFEGLMIRHVDGPYKIAGRSADLFKFKLFADEECLILDIWEDQNGNAMFSVRRKNGVELNVTPKRTHEERKALLGRTDLIGKWLTVKYQTETPDGNLQFPVGLDLRECDDQGNPIV